MSRIIPQNIRNRIDSNNSTSSALGIGGVFTGSWTDITGYGIIYINVFSNVASGTDGLIIEQSSDGTNSDHEDVYTIPANIGKNYSINPYARYLRIDYTNGGVGQTSFRLQVVLKKTGKPSSHRISDSIVDEDDAELSKSVITAKKDDGTFINLASSDSGNLRITGAENGLAISKSEVSGTSFIHKFGNAPDYDIADGYVTVWDGADDGGINEMTYNYSSTADIDSVSSSSAGDNQSIEVYGLDTNYDLSTQTATLNGQTRVALTTALIRVFRVINRGSTDLAGNVYCYVNTALAVGVPIDTTKIRAQIHIGNNQTLMAVYTIPNGYTGYMRDWYASISGAKKTSSHTVHVVARPDGEVFQLKHKSSIVAVGSSNIHYKYMEPKVFSAKTDLEVQVNSDEDQAEVSAGFDLVLVAD